MSDHAPRDLDELLGAFALDAVDPEERELVERHLASDPVARAEVDEMRETAAVLASLPRDDEGAPAGLWDRIAGAIGTPEPSDATEAIESVPAPPIPITRATRATRVTSVPARVVMPIAAAAAIIIALLTVQVATRAPNRAGDVAAAYNHAVANGATKLELKASGDTTVAADIALQRDGTGYLRNAHLAALPEGKTYQLWALTKQGQKSVVVISAGVLGRDPRAVAFHVASQPDAFAVTVEDAPGVVASKNTPVATAGVIPL